MNNIILSAASSIQETVTDTAAKGFNFSIPGEDFAQALPIMGKGMLGIFIVIGIVILCVMLLNHLTSPDRKKDNEAKIAAQSEKRAAKILEKENKK